MVKSRAARADDPIPGVPVEAKPLRMVLFVLTVLSAAAALFLAPALAGAVRRGALGSGWLFLPLALYCVFFLVYAVDRWLLVRKRRYPAGRAFFQIVFGLLFGLILLPSTLRDFGETDRVPSESPRLPGAAQHDAAEGPTHDAGMVRLLTHPDPEVRQASVEAIGYRGFSPRHAGWLRARLEDRSPQVRRAATTVLAQWSGKDASEVEALSAWAAEAAAATSTTSVEGTR